MTRFDNAVSKLIKAFFDETLEKGQCSCCAVGNICDNKSDWKNLFVTLGTSEDREQINCIRSGITDTDARFFSPEELSEIREKAFDTIKQTGYNAYELAKVEKAFEENTEAIKIGSDKYENEEGEEISHDEYIKDQFNGLCAVIDVLCQLEGINNPDQYKKMLREKPELENL